jgi:DNA-directed RNA polymerase I and III subunit RPAC2
MNNSRIAFAGYSVPHPSEPVVHIRVQTAKISQKDKESDRPRAVDLLKEACETLVTQCDIVIDQIEGIMPEVEKDRIAIEDALKQDSLNEDGEDAAQEEADDFDEEMMDGTEEY